jgi:hypothetical protein
VTSLRSPGPAIRSRDREMPVWEFGRHLLSAWYWISFRVIGMIMSGRVKCLWLPKKSTVLYIQDGVLVLSPEPAKLTESSNLLVPILPMLRAPNSNFPGNKQVSWCFDIPSKQWLFTMSTATSFTVLH